MNSESKYITHSGIFYRGAISDKDLKKSTRYLQPLYEAITNCFEAIMMLPENNDKGEICINLFFNKGLLPDNNIFDQLMIQDNGIGFDDDNFLRLQTLKDYRKGFANKGTGRIQFIHFFKTTECQSIFKRDNQYIKGHFILSKAKEFLDNNSIIKVFSESNVDNDSTGTKLFFKDLLEESDQEKYSQLTIDELKRKIITHYIQYFCAHRENLPKIILKQYLEKELQKEENISPNDLPEIDDESDLEIRYSKLSSDGKEIEKSGNSEKFHLKAFKINKGKNNGKNSSEDYTDAKRVKVPHDALKPGDNCPDCLKGKIYPSTPSTTVRITGATPIQATIYEFEKLRCNLCGKIFTAKTPDGVSEEKYDEKALALVAMMRYGFGVPFYRLESLQKMLGVPLADSTQWDLVERLADRIYPAYRELCRVASNGDLFYNDDTTVKILSLMKENETDAPARKGMFTTGILSKLKIESLEITISLFFSGRNHAGENLGDILEDREKTRGTPIQMCDALNRNIPPGFDFDNAFCLSHARRNFVKVEEQFPEEVEYLLDQVGTVYKNDKDAKEQNLSPEERLKLHQELSSEPMDAIDNWICKKLDKDVEPNSGLGSAMRYMKKHWERLTTFLRVAGTPLDNNECEQALKKPILQRKNSMFYKSEHGAYIGDLFIGLINTCSLNNVNPFEYLVALQNNVEQIRESPEMWMPWNYQESIDLNG